MELLHHGYEFVFVFFSPFSIAITSLGERELILVLFVRLFDLCLFGSVGFLFLLVSEKGCGLWLWHSLDFSRTIFLAGQPNFAIIFQSPSRLTVSNALVRSTKVMWRSTFCSWHFSWSCHAVKIMSVVPLSYLNPHWLYGRSPDCSRRSFNRFSRTLARILPAIDNKEMPRWLSQTRIPFPFE